MANFYEKPQSEEKPDKETGGGEETELDYLNKAYSLTPENAAEIREMALKRGEDPEAALATVKANLKRMKKAAIARAVKKSGEAVLKQFYKGETEVQKNKKEQPPGAERRS